MKLTVAMFAHAKQLVGASSVELLFETAPTVAELQRELIRKFPQLEALMKRSALAVDQQYVSVDQQIFEGSEIAVIPPVSGG